MVAVNDGWQSEPNDGPTSGGRQRSVVVMKCSCGCSCRCTCNTVVVVFVVQCSIV